MYPTSIILADQKGGVNKTTTTVNLSVDFAAQGKKVLLTGRAMRDEPFASEMSSLYDPGTVRVFLPLHLLPC